MVAEQGVVVYVFEAFDENWKGSDHPLESEKVISSTGRPTTQAGAG